jgi:hypothetical protein
MGALAFKAERYVVNGVLSSLAKKLKAAVSTAAVRVVENGGRRSEQFRTWEWIPRCSAMSSLSAPNYLAPVSTSYNV